jgi:hypothetical protein
MIEHAKNRIESTEETWTPLLHADVLAAAHYLTVYGKTKLIEPEKRLMLAVLTDAIETYQDYILRRKVVTRVQYEQVERWILERNREWPFSFENICDTFGLNPQYVRRGLECWKERTLSHPPRFVRLRGKAARRHRVVHVPKAQHSG